MKSVQTSDNQDNKLVLHAEVDFESDESNRGAVTETSGNDSGLDSVASTAHDSETDEEGRLKLAELEKKWLQKLEKESKARVEKKIKSKVDRSSARRKSREYQQRLERRERLKRLEKENEERMQKIEKLNQMEDDLSQIAESGSDQDTRHEQLTTGECREQLIKLLGLNAVKQVKIKSKTDKDLNKQHVSETLNKMLSASGQVTGGFKVTNSMPEHVDMQVKHDECRQTSTHVRHAELCKHVDSDSNVDSGSKKGQMKSGSHGSHSSRSANSRKRSHSPAESTDSEQDTDSTERRHPRKGKKLKSGGMAKKDELDIKRVVKFLHTKLNREFTDVKDFEALTPTLFVEGELEIIGRCKSDLEKQA